MILDKTLILKGVAGVGAVGAAGGTYIYREELGIVSSSKRVETEEEKKNREDIEKAMIENLDDARIEFIEWVPNGIAWKNLVDFMEDKENKKVFLNLSSTNVGDSSNKGKIEELLKFLKEFLCALEEHNIFNVLALNIGDIDKLTSLIEKLNNTSTLTQDEISDVKKLFVSVHKDVEEINNVPASKGRGGSKRKTKCS